MLKKRSKAVSSSKQGVMSHSFSPTSLFGNLAHRPISSSLFPAINPLLCLYPKLFPGPDASVKIPNSTLYFKPFTSICNPFFSDRNSRTGMISKASWDARNHKPVGLGIVDDLSCEKTDEKFSNSENRIVWSGSQIKVQIPSTCQSYSFQTPWPESPHCPIEFGVKNKEAQLAMALLSPGRKSPLGSAIPSTDNSPRTLRRLLSASEIELSEDYTCVISHGPQQKKTHIFDNFIIESYSNGFSSFGKIMAPADQFGSFASDYFSTSCHSCTYKIARENEVFIYRERAFCSHECRNREIVRQEGGDHSTS